MRAQYYTLTITSEDTIRMRKGMIEESSVLACICLTLCTGMDWMGGIRCLRIPFALWRTPEVLTVQMNWKSYLTMTFHLYSGPTREFFLQDGDSTTSSICKEDADHDSSSDADDDDGESLEGLYEGAKHTFYSLKATILYHVGSSPRDVQELLSHAVHMDDMTPGDKAAVLLFKATTIRNCGDRGLDMAMDILKKAILIDPDNLSWPLMLIIYSGEKRRSKCGGKRLMSQKSYL
uniref:Uncharacterized protein n=1 Tax=Lygus hesperus TaxID=30085 RepID=A0A0K8SL81_LYGHE